MTGLVVIRQLRRSALARNIRGSNGIEGYEVAEDDAVLGYRVRRGGYMKRTEVTAQTATRDLTALASAGILSPHGTGRGRHYIAGEPLHTIQDRRRATRKPLRDPYPWMRAKLAEPV